jgi:RHS repeat-associated protein
MIRRWLVAAIGVVLWGTTSVFAQSSDQVTYYHTDAIGSVRAITDASGQLVAREDFLPFGEPWLVPPTPDVRQFTGQERDAHTGLDYFGVRDYQSGSGRFIRPDDPGYADPFDPQSLNLYAYAYNNPLRFVDPTGHAGDCLFGYDEKTGLCTPGLDPSTFQWLWDSLTRIRTSAVASAREFIEARRDPSCMTKWAGAGTTGAFAFGTALGAAAGGPPIVLTAPGAVAVNMVGGLAAGSVMCMGSASGGGGGGSGSNRSSAGKMQRQVERGQAPGSVDRVDKARIPYEKDQVHFKDGSALNHDGRWKHGGRPLTRAEADWLVSNGWSLPQ